MEEIKIKSVQDRKPFGNRGNSKLTFYGEDGKKYEVYAAELDKYIIAGNTIKADVDVSKRDHEGTTYEDRKVTQIYVDGQPMLQKRQAGQGWAQGSRAKDPVERSSIEAQVAAKVTAELWIAGKVDVKFPQVEALQKWLLSKLIANTDGAPPVKTTQKSDTPTQKTEQKATPAAKQTPDPFDALGVSPDILDGPNPAKPIRPDQLETIQVYLDAKIPLGNIIQQYGWGVMHKENLTEDQADRLINDVEATVRAKEKGLPAEAKAAAKRG